MGFRRTFPVALMPLGLLIAACSGSTQKTGSVGSSPTADVYAALERGDYAALPNVIAALDEVVKNDPNDENAAFYAGVMHLWRGDSAVNDPSDASGTFATDITQALQDLGSARKLNPSDPHPPGFYGIAQIDAGKLVNSEDTIDQGASVLEDAVPLYPAYIHGIQALAFGALPKSHVDFPKALQALHGTSQACESGAGDAAPVFAYSADQPIDRRGTCSDEGVVAHVWEGFWLTYGDITSKQGDAATARLAYDNAKSAPHYDRWTLRDTLDERLNDLDTRTQLYLDGDPTNDPKTWMEEGHLCVGCHASTQ